MTQARLDLALYAALSNERLSSYARAGTNYHAAIGTYLWNMALCEALYPVLQGLEIVLRNTLDTAIADRYPVTAHFGIESWLDRDPPVLDEADRPTVEDAKQRLLERSKPATPGRLVAELNFGFWTALLDVRYERNQVFWPHLLRAAFPAAPKSLRTRKNISPRLNRIRHLRNRVFHHEPVWHWTDLRNQYDIALEMIGWISPAFQRTMGVIDRFPPVHAGGSGPYSRQYEVVAAALAGVRDW
jgi:hypothetical protein